MLRPAMTWRTPASTVLPEGAQMEAIDDPTDEDSVQWRGVVQRMDASTKQVCAYVAGHPDAVGQLQGERICAQD